MSVPDRRDKGAAMMQKVYAEVVPVPPAGQSAFADLMLEQLFAEVWTREALSVRDRRLLTMGVIAAPGAAALDRVGIGEGGCGDVVHGHAQRFSHETPALPGAGG